MDCPRCKNPLVHVRDFDCEDVACDCGNGVVSYYKCKDCRVEVELTTDCLGEREDEEEWE